MTLILQKPHERFGATAYSDTATMLSLATSFSIRRLLESREMESAPEHEQICIQTCAMMADADHLWPHSVPQRPSMTSILISIRSARMLS